MRGIEPAELLYGRLLGRRGRRSGRCADPDRGRALARADAAAATAIAAVPGFTKAEVERIWLCLAPLTCLAAAGALQDRHVRPVLAALGVQALAWELLWNTVS